MKFRKKIDAVHYAGGGNLDPRGALPDWIWEAFRSGTLRSTNGNDRQQHTRHITVRGVS